MGLPPEAASCEVPQRAQKHLLREILGILARLHTPPDEAVDRVVIVRCPRRVAVHHFLYRTPRRNVTPNRAVGYPLQHRKSLGTEVKRTLRLWHLPSHPWAGRQLRFSLGPALGNGARGVGCHHLRQCY